MRPPSRVRLCSVFKEPVPSSGGFPVSRRRPLKSRAFFGAARRRAPVRKRSRFFSGFARWKDRARASPGEGKIRKLPRDVKRKPSAERKKSRRNSGLPVLPWRGRRVRATRRQGRESAPAREVSMSPRGRRNLTHFRSIGSHRRTFPSVCLRRRLDLSFRRRNPTKVGFRLEKRGRRHPSARAPAGNVSRRPSTVHPPARSAARVAG